ncbi:MAG: TetR family transcriptional regulator [Acidimicrobiales bacterium]
MAHTGRLSDPAEVAEAGQRRAGTMTLRQLVALSGVPASTVRHYRRLGLLPALAPLENGHFGYADAHLRALQLIRELRAQRCMPLSQVKAALPALMEGRQPPEPGPPAPMAEPHDRVIEAAFRLFSEPKGYYAVTVAEIAAAAGVAKGSVYRYFPSKEALFTAVVIDVCDDTARRFAQAVEDLGGPQGLASDPAKTAVVFGRVIARAMPILLELGARAARGDLASQLLAARVLRILAEAAGRPLSDDPVPAGLKVIEAAFATVLQWAVSPEWSHPGPSPS